MSTPLLADIIGKSKPMQDIARIILKSAKSDVNVLLYGESGVGKELLAKSIHFNSRRSDKSFLPLDCVALPPTLLESELFGFERGAFTGATKMKPGLLELAEGGTIFLDEITEFDINLQSKLLRIIQERQFRRIGGKKAKKMDIRIISATNRNPEKAVRDNKLRQDLYFRLKVIPIYIPPLRDRIEDIPLLAAYFLKQYNPDYQNRIKGFSTKALRCLKKYNWPGNVRELQNVIQNAMLLTEHDSIQVEDLPVDIIENRNIFFDKTLQKLDFKDAKHACLKQFTQHYFHGLLDRHDGNITRVAREAGLSRRTLYRLFENFGIER